MDSNGSSALGFVVEPVGAVRRFGARRIVVRIAWLGLALLGLNSSAPAFAGDEGGHEFHRHHVGVFVGGGCRPGDGGDAACGFAAGVDYEFRFSKWVGLGLDAEVATGDLRDAVIAGLVFVHPWKGLLVVAGPGAEISSHGTEYVTRLGAAYQFPIADRFTLAPTFAVDVVNREPVYIYGITVGIGF